MKKAVKNKKSTRAPALNMNNYNKEFLPKSKRSQAFLITAIVLIAVIMTFVVVFNFSKKTSFSDFPYVAEEIQIESEKVMDYALLNPDDTTAIETFTGDVSNYIDKDTRIYFITGNVENNIELYNYDENGNSVGVSISELTATIDSTTYEFPKPDKGEVFYFIMIKEDKGEKYIYTNVG